MTTHAMHNGHERLDAAAAQIATFTSIVYAPDDIVEIRCLRKDGPAEQDWTPAERLPDMSQRLAMLNEQFNVYLGANPRTHVGGSEAGHVALARCLFADFDNGATVEDALARIEVAGLPQPTMIVNSGHGVHFWWLLVKPLTDLAEFTRLQKALAAELGSDSSIHDPSRIMRLPGFQNVRREPHVPCYIVESEPDRRYPIELFREVLAQHIAKQLEPAKVENNGTAAKAGLNDVGRAALYIAKIPPACEGDGRNNAAFKVCAAVRNDFDLSDSDAWSLACRWNEGNSPPLEEKELRSVFDSAAKSAKKPRGNKLNAAPEWKATGDVTAATGQDAIHGGTTAKGKVLTYRTMTAAELDAAEFTTEYLIDWVLAAGQPCILAGPKKALKTTLLCILAVALATGSAFLRKFKVNRACRVLFMTGESGLATIQETLRRAAESMGHSLSDVGGLIVSDQLPQFGQGEHIAALRRLLTENESEILICDPAYLCMPTDGNEGSLFAMGGLLRTISELCQEIGVTLILAHHTKKGVADPYAPPELEDIAWAGFQEFARQWALVGRRERYEPGSGLHLLWLTTGGSAGHSGAFALDIDEGQFAPGKPRTLVLNVTTAAEAREEAQGRRADAKQADRAAKDRAIRDVVKTAIRDALSIAPGNVDTTGNIRARSGHKGKAFDAALAELLREGKVAPAEIERANGHKYDGYKWTPKERLGDLADSLGESAA